MTKPDPTRRDFLLKLAKTVAFVPPAMASLSVRPLAGQGKTTTTTSSSSETTSGGGKGGTTSSDATTVGSTSPTAQVIDQSQFNLEGTTTTSPWDARAPGQPPPWSRPPPTQTGR